MGCCMSSTPKGDPPHHSPQKPPALEQHTRSTHVAIASQASLEEETVKEVLSETPILKPQQATTKIPNFQERKSQIEIFQEPAFQECNSQVEIFEEPKIQAQIFEEPKSQVQIFTRNKRKNGEEEEDQERERTPEVSQASEICSIADSYSTATTATTTITEIREDHEVTSKRRVVNRSPSKIPRKRSYNGERERVPKRPPVKREFSGQSRTTSASMTQRNVGPNRVGRDLGERSNRRSRSPATRGSGGGAVKGRAGGSPAKGIGKTVGRKEEAGAGSGAKKEQKSQNDSVLMQEQPQAQAQAQGNESLENPLVSLECFIFL